MQKPLNNLKIKEWSQTDATEKNAQALFQVAEAGFQNGSPWSQQQFHSTLNAINASVIVASFPKEAQNLGEIKDQNQAQSHSQIEKVAGVLVATKNIDEADIYLIVVDEEYKQMGIAQKMFRYLIEQCQNEKMTAIFLEVRKSNHPAIALYQSLGFEEVGIRKAYYSSPIEDAIVMKLAL